MLRLGPVQIISLVFAFHLTSISWANEYNEIFSAPVWQDPQTGLIWSELSENEYNSKKAREHCAQWDARLPLHDEVESRWKFQNWDELGKRHRAWAWTQEALRDGHATPITI
jgi:hypothetical protein